VHDFGKEIHNLLPFSDGLRGHFDRMCRARAAILRLGSDAFLVKTPVHGEGSITAPAAVRHSSHGGPSRRCGHTSSIRGGSIAPICRVRLVDRAPGRSAQLAHQPVGHLPGDGELAIPLELLDRG